MKFARFCARSVLFAAILAVLPVACTDDLPSCKSPHVSGLEIGNADWHEKPIYVVAEQNHWQEAYLFTSNDNNDDFDVMTVDLRHLLADFRKNTGALPQGTSPQSGANESGGNSASSASFPKPNVELDLTFKSIHLSHDNRNLMVHIGATIYQVSTALPATFGFSVLQPLSPPQTSPGDSENRTITKLVEDALLVYGTPGNKNWLVYTTIDKRLCAKYIGEFQDEQDDNGPSFCFADHLPELRPVAFGHSHLAAFSESENSKTPKRSENPKSGSLYLLTFPQVELDINGQTVAKGNGVARNLSDSPRLYKKAIFARNDFSQSKKGVQNRKVTEDRLLIVSTDKRIEIFNLDQGFDRSPTYLAGKIISGEPAFGEVDGLSAISPDHRLLAYKNSYNSIVLHNLNDAVDVCALRRGHVRSSKRDDKIAGWAQDGSIYLQTLAEKRGNKKFYNISRYESPKSQRKFLYKSSKTAGEARLQAVPSSGSSAQRRPWAVAKTGLGNLKSLSPLADKFGESLQIDDNCLAWPSFPTILNLAGNSLDIANLSRPTDQNGNNQQTNFRLEITRKSSPATNNCNRKVNLLNVRTRTPFSFKPLAQSESTSTKLCISASNLLWSSICQPLPTGNSEKDWGGGTNSDGADHIKSTGSGLTKTGSDKNGNDNPA